MRRLLPLAAAMAALASSVAAETVDEIIAKNVEARGGLDKIKAVRALRMTGTMTMGPGLESPMTMELKRGNRLRMEFTFGGMTGVQAFDGKNGWVLMPFGGRKDPEPMPPEALKDAEEQADIDGPLVDYKSKGHTVEYVGKGRVEGSDAYKLKLTLKNGGVRTLWIDSKAFLEIKGEGKRTINGSEVESETLLGDYKAVGGVMYPHSVVGGPKGSKQRQGIVIDKIEVNPPLDDTRFKMPEIKKESPKPPEEPES